MDQYDRLIHDILTKTENNLLDWDVTAAGVYETAVLNAHRLIRAYRTTYVLGEQKYTLLFLESKVDRFDELGELYEGRGFELLVLGEDKIPVFNLYDGVVELEDLVKLSSLLQDHNTQAKRFFAEFEKAFVR